MINILPYFNLSNIYSWSPNDNSNLSCNDNCYCFIVFEHGVYSLMNLIGVMSISMKVLSVMNFLMRKVN